MRILLARIAQLLPVLTILGGTAPRQIFELVIPEANLRVPQNQSVTVPHPFISRLRLRLDGSPQRFDYGRIVTRLNGESASVIMKTTSDKRGIICDLDLNFRAGFRLQRGRNSVEILAEDLYGRSYFGSFAVYVGEQARSGSEIQTRVHRGSRDSPAPRIVLTRPAEPLSDADRNVVFEGYVFHSRIGLTLNIGGHASGLRQVKRTSRGMVRPAPGQLRFRFQQEVELAPQITEVKVSALDIGGSRTDVVVPIFPSGPAAARRRFAVVVGVSEYRHQSLRLRYAHRDAQAFRKLLIDRMGFPRSNVLLLINEDATAEGIRSSLFTFLAQTEETDLVVIFFAGHGMRDPNNPLDLYLLPYDAAPDNMGGTALPMWRMRDLFMRTLKSQNVVTFVDACRSAGIGGDGSHNLINQYVAKSASMGRRSVLVASDIGELAQESEALQAGVFTHFLLRGLRGEADGDADGLITTGELFSFVRDGVFGFTGGRQTPVALSGLNHHQAIFPNQKLEPLEGNEGYAKQ